jgi:hypothetical protein
MSDPAVREGLTEKQASSMLRLAAKLNQLGVDPVRFLADAVTAESEAQSILRANGEEPGSAKAVASLLSIRPVQFEQVDLLRAPSVLSSIELSRGSAWGSPRARTLLSHVSKSIAGKFPRGKPRSIAKYSNAWMRYALFLSIWDEILERLGRPPRVRRGREARLPRLELGARIQALITQQVKEHKKATDMHLLKKKVNASDARRLRIDETESFEMLRPRSRSRRVHTPIGLPVPKARAAIAFLGNRVDDYDDALAEVEKLRKVASRPWKRSS